MEKVGARPLIFYVVERMKLLKLPVIVATSTDPSDDVLCNYLQSQNYPYFRGSLNNVLQRYIDAANHYEIDRIVRITADNPLVDTRFLIESLSLFIEYDYADGIYQGGFIPGTGFELVSLSELLQIPSSEKDHQEHVTLWLREHLEYSEKRIQLLPSVQNKFREDVFLSCDYPEDLEFLKEIFRHYKYRTDIKIEEVNSLLEKRPALKRINSTLHQA